MKVFGEFDQHSQCAALHANGRSFRATWVMDPGYVETPGLTEINVRVDDESGADILYMRWLVADIGLAGGKEGVLDALEGHSPEAADWAACMQRNRDHCPPAVMAAQAIGLLSLIATVPGHLGRGLGTPLARAFAMTVLAPLGVRSFWIKPVPLAEHPATGFFKPQYASDSTAFRDASSRLERHYERSLDAEWTCPDYLRVDISPAETSSLP